LVPPLMVTKTLSIAMLCDPFIKNGGIDGNPLGIWMEHVRNKWNTIFPCWEKKMMQFCNTYF
jgi:uncharacterized protein YvpB